MVTLTLDSQHKIDGLAELLLVAAKAANVSPDGMKLALMLIDDLKAAVAVANEAAPAADEQKEAA